MIENEKLFEEVKKQNKIYKLINKRVITKVSTKTSTINSNTFTYNVILIFDDFIYYLLTFEHLNMSLKRNYFN